MRLFEWSPIAAVRASAPAGVSAPFQLTVVFQGEHRRRAEQQIRFELEAHGLQLMRLQVFDQPGQPLVRLTACVKNTATARAGLVKLVQRLGLEPAVRSVRWESVPQPPAGAPRNCHGTVI
jgi:hypothetical protein